MLKHGVTLVFDVRNKEQKNKVGNERRLQGAWNVFPLRPKHIYIYGASTFFRISFNLLLKVASVVTNNKVIQRIQFVSSLQQLSTNIPPTSLPKYMTQQSMEDEQINDITEKMTQINLKQQQGIETNIISHNNTNNNHKQEMIDWVRKRIAQFPIPKLDE